MPRSFCRQADTGGASNRAGRFAFTRLKPGWHELVVTHVAYQEEIDSIWVAPSVNNRQVEVHLTPRIVSTEPIVIHGNGISIAFKRTVLIGDGASTIQMVTG